MYYRRLYIATRNFLVAIVIAFFSLLLEHVFTGSNWGGIGRTSDENRIYWSSALVAFCVIVLIQFSREPPDMTDDLAFDEAVFLTAVFLTVHLVFYVLGVSTLRPEYLA